MKEKKTQVITFRTTEEMKRIIQNEAERRGRTTAQFVEAIVMQYIMFAQMQRTKNDSPQIIMKRIKELNIPRTCSTCGEALECAIENRKKENCNEWTVNLTTFQDALSKLHIENPNVIYTITNNLNKYFPAKYNEEGEVSGSTDNCTKYYFGYNQHGRENFRGSRSSLEPLLLFSITENRYRDKGGGLTAPW